MGKYRQFVVRTNGSRSSEREGEGDF